MTANDSVQQNGSPSRSRSLGWIFACLIGGVFSAGAAAGYYRVAAESGALSPFDLTMIAAFVLVAIGCAVQGYRLIAARMAGSGSTGPRMQVVNKAMAAALVLGTVIGMALTIAAGPDDGFANFLNAATPLPPLVAGLLVAAVALSMVLSALWLAHIDEHEAAANNFGAQLGIHTYVALSLGWWFAARGGLAPAPDGQAIFWAVMVVWGLGWLWKRYR